MCQILLKMGLSSGSTEENENMDLQRHFLYYALIVRSLKNQAKNNKQKQQKNIRPELII